MYGSILWSTKIVDSSPEHGYKGARCSPAIDGDRVYAIGSNGSIACLAIADGAIVWQKDFKKEWKGQLQNDWGFSESPLVDGDLLLCTPGGKDAMIVALNKQTGETVWKAAVPEIGSRGKDGAGYSSIVVSNACGVKQYVQLIGRGVIGLRASDGKFLWGYNEIANPTANVPTPIVSDDFIFCSTGYGGGGSALLQLVKEGDGIQAVEKYYHDAKTLQNHHGGMVLKDGYVYFGHKHGQGFPVCVEMESGKILWGGDTRGPGNGSAGVTYADGNLIFRYESGDVALIQATPSGYHLKGVFKQDYLSRKKSWAHPVIAGGKLYLREQDKLMCYDIKE
jgi:outer membrane protein assembly factor BamB